MEKVLFHRSGLTGQPMLPDILDQGCKPRHAHLLPRTIKCCVLRRHRP